MSNPRITESKAIKINFADHDFLLLASGCCYWLAKKTLLVSDLHLEKGSYFASKGQPLPVADTRDTLERLSQEIERLQPERVICLGDNVHDAHAFLRMNPQDLNRLDNLYRSVTEWNWIIGNHDKLTFNNHSVYSINCVTSMIIDGICFAHELQSKQPYQIIGHYHPKMTVKKYGIRISGACFLVTHDRLIMPAFGSYTGGLDINHSALQSVSTENKRYYLLFNNHIFFSQ